MKEMRLNTLCVWLFTIAVLLLPIFFLPSLINPLINSKLLLFFSIALGTALIFLVKSLRAKGITLIKSPLFWTMLVFAGLVLVSSFASHQYPIKQLVGMGGAYLSFAVIVVLLPSILHKSASKQFSLGITIASLIISVLSITGLFGYGAGFLVNLVSNIAMPTTLAFSLTGASFITIQFLSVVILSTILDQNYFKANVLPKINVFLAAVALAIHIVAVLPNGEARFQSLSLTASTTIARNSLTFTKNALFGYGPDSYGNAYSILKPIWINGLNYWKFTFDAAFNLPLTIIVSLGLLAFLVYLFLVWQIATMVKQTDNNHQFLRLFVGSALAWQFFAPGNIVMLALLAIGLALLVYENRSEYKKIQWSIHHLSDILNRGKWVKGRTALFYAITTASTLIIVLAGVGVARAFLSYNLLHQSNVSITKNEIAEAYDEHKQAKALAPELDFVRRSYALVNLQIAIALSNKVDISPAEQEQVLQLVNQAIREARAATVLDPQNYLNWSVLAQIYMQLLNNTDQAKQEAFNALARAATYNPNNPEIRLALGQLFMNTNRASEAIAFFDQAIERKPDLFVAHYSMAQVLLATNQKTEAKAYFISALNLLPKESEEYAALEKELNELLQTIETDAQGTAPKTDMSGDLTPTPVSTAASSLGSILDQENTESLIQDGALETDQQLIEN